MAVFGIGTLDANLPTRPKAALAFGMTNSKIIYEGISST
jgi:hypothetical protein